MSKIIFVMGKSASGKDTIYNRLSSDQELKLQKIILYTTRPMRAGEIDGVSYNFSDEDKLSQLMQAGKIVELRSYDTIYGVWKYFTVADEGIDLKNNNYVTIGTLESFSKYKEYFGEENIVPVFVEVEDGERLKRAINRQQQEERPEYAEICRRFLADEKDFSKENMKKAGITDTFENNDLEECYTRIKKAIMQAINKDDF